MYVCLIQLINEMLQYTDLGQQGVTAVYVCSTRSSEIINIIHNYNYWNCKVFSNGTILKKNY